MVTPHEDGHAGFDRLLGGPAQRGCPADRLGQGVEPVARFHFACVGQHVAKIPDLVAEILQGTCESRGAKGVRAHETAPPGLAAVDRGADEEDAFALHWENS